MTDIQERFAKIAAQSDRLRREALRVYRPFPNTEKVHKSNALERIIYGGKRAGKSVVASTEFGSLVTGIPIIGIDGQPIPRVHPISTKEDPLIYWIIGWDLKHIGQTIYKLLFLPGMGGTLKCMEDPETNEYRILNKANPEDMKHWKTAKLTEPIIPERMVEDIIYNDGRKKEFSCVVLTNGAKIFAYPSSAKNPKQGDAVAGIWIDEDIMFYNHVKEYQDRLTDLNGWFLWSAWAHQDNPAIEDLIDRADACEEEEDPQIQAFRLAMTDNPYITDDSKKKALARMGSAEEIARRNEGYLETESSQMYDFAAVVHGIEPKKAELVSKIKTPLMWLQNHLSRYGRLPIEWTRYLSVDPSFTRTACHSFVIPSPDWEGIEFPNMILCEWELIGKRWGPDDLAGNLERKMMGLRYEAFIMDKSMGRQTRVGTDGTVFEAYANAFAKRQITSRLTGEGFLQGCNVPPTRYRAVRWALDASRGVPILLFVTEKCPETFVEFRSYRKKTLTIGQETTMLDEPKNPRKHDCMASVEYAVEFLKRQIEAGQAFVDPALHASRGSPAYLAAQQMLKTDSQFGQSTNGGFVHLGAGQMPMSM